MVVPVGANKVEITIRPASRLMLMSLTLVCNRMELDGKVQ